MPYAPGRAQGELRWIENTDSLDTIAMLYPNQIDQLREMPTGLVVIDGAPFSHLTISLLRLGIPTVILDKDQVSNLSEGTFVTLDGSSGIITTGKAAETLPKWNPPAVSPGKKQLFTADGEPVILLSSIRDAEGARNASNNGASAIGLLRTEFLQPDDGRRPDQEFYERAFGKVCSAAGALPVTIRLLDISPGKYPSWLSPIQGAQTPLGLQGVRLFNKNPVINVIKAQLEAIQTLSNRCQFRLIIPFLSKYEELLYWRDHVRQILPENIPVGAMIETPAGAIDIARWLDTVDFVAVGCNDLMQSVFAADRDQPILQSYLDPYAPVLFRLFKQMADSAEGQLDKVQLCGLLPQYAGVMPILLGLGYRIFSVEAMLIPHLTEIIEKIPTQSAQTLAEQVCNARQTTEVKKLLGY